MSLILWQSGRSSTFGSRARKKVGYSKKIIGYICADFLQLPSKVDCGRYMSNSQISTLTSHQASASSTGSSTQTSTSCTFFPHEVLRKLSVVQVRIRLLGCYKSDLVAYVRHDQHLRGLPSATPSVSQSDRSFEWRGGSITYAGTEEL